MSRAFCFITMVCQRPEPERRDHLHYPKVARHLARVTKQRGGLLRSVGRSVVSGVPDRSCTAFPPIGRNRACSKSAEKRPRADQPLCASRFPPSPHDAALQAVARPGRCRHRAIGTPEKVFAEKWSGYGLPAKAGHKPPDAAGISAPHAPFHQIDVSSLGPRTCRAYMIAVCQDWHVQETPHDHRFANRLGRYRPAIST